MTSLLDIPIFLRIPQAERAETWKGRRLTNSRNETRRTSWRWNFPKSLTDAECRAELRRQQQIEKTKREARFAHLREIAAAKRKQAVRTS